MSAALKLEIFHHGELLQELPIDGDASTAEYWVGREEGCVIRLEDRAISRKHAIFRPTSRGIEFEKKSKFGWMKVNGKESAHAFLKDGDQVELGPYEIRVSGKMAKKGVDATLLIPEEGSSQNFSQSAIEAPIHSLPLAGVEVVPSSEEDYDMASPITLEGGTSESSDISVQEVVPVELFDSPQGSAHGSSEASSEAGALELDIPQKTGMIDLAAVIQDGDTKLSTSPEKVKALLIFGEGVANVTEYEMGDDEIAIGRSQQCHVVLEDKRSSRKHSIIKRDGLKYVIEDQGSANGTLINGIRMDSHELQSGDQIQIGDTSFVFRILQIDYEQKKQEFIEVPPQESEAVASPLPNFIHPQGSPDLMSSADQAQPAPSFEVPQGTSNNGILRKYIERYRAMNTRQQIIWGAVVLVVIWFMLEDDPQRVPVKTMNKSPKKDVKKEEKKVGVGQTFESLTPEQQRYIEAQYQLGFELYKNREYDKSILELSKIFAILQDYKQAREIEAFAREGKRKLEQAEEEKRKLEEERQSQLKLQSLLEQAGHFMDKRRFKEAEALFPDIELLQPENVAVSEWRKIIIADGERIERERAAKLADEEFHEEAWKDFDEAKVLVDQKKYYDALDFLDEIGSRPLKDKKLVSSIQSETTRAEQELIQSREPFLEQGSQLEKEKKFIPAYEAYKKASLADPYDHRGQEGMDRIRNQLTSKAKIIYSEGVFAESYGDVDVAEKRYLEVQDVVPSDDDYYLKAQSRIERLNLLKRAGDSAP